MRALENHSRSLQADRDLLGFTRSADAAARAAAVRAWDAEEARLAEAAGLGIGVTGAIDVDATQRSRSQTRQPFPHRLIQQLFTGAVLLALDDLAQCLDCKQIRRHRHLMSVSRDR